MRRTRAASIVAVAAVVVCYSLFGKAGADVLPLYTSTRSVTGLAVAEDGAVWASTRGGVLCRSADGVWHKFTCRDGLPSNEVFEIKATGESVWARCPGGPVVCENGKWQDGPKLTDTKPSEELCRVRWQDKDCVATLTELKIREGEKWRSAGLPPSTGSHISAMLPRGDKLWVMMFGDGFWTYDGKAWTRAGVELPVEAKEVTAVTDAGGKLVIGTRREGVWEQDGKSWKQHLQPDEPYNTNCQNIIAFRDALFISTLEDGLAVRRGGKWTRYCAPEISSDAPRQMVECDGALYLRHGSGKVDRFDGERWTKDVFKDLPRKQVSAIAADGRKVYAAQWGGWSEFDGKIWEHHLKIDELQGYAITALLPDGERMWVGTQGRGLAEVERSTGKVTWHDERHGLPDDWVKHLVKCRGRVFAGTFVGGLASWDGKTWRRVGPEGQVEITDLKTDLAGDLLVGTRGGVWRVFGDERVERFKDELVPEEVDAQALCVDDGRVWIGTRVELWSSKAL